MKSLKEYSLNLSEKDYHAYPAWSYSMIARYAREGFGAIATLHEPVEQTDSMRFGSLFDCMLTHGMDVDKEFVVGIKVPDAERKVLDTLIQISDARYYIEVTDNELAKAIEMTGYQSRWKFDTQKAHIDPFAEYYNEAKSGKTIVTQEEWSDAFEMLKAVKTDEYLSKHFKKDIEDNVEYIYQAQFKTEYSPFGGKDTVEIKIMPDMLEVNHTEKTIQPWDVKTSSVPAYDFAQHFVKFRYDIQASLYSDVLQAVINKIPEYQDYKILPYLFMDISRTDKVPVTYEYNPWSETQDGGLSFESNGRTIKYKGYRQLLEEIIEYETTMTKVPKYVTTTAPNDLVALLNFNR